MADIHNMVQRTKLSNRLLIAKFRISCQVVATFLVFHTKSEIKIQMLTTNWLLKK